MEVSLLKRFTLHIVTALSTDLASYQYHYHNCQLVHVMYMYTCIGRSNGSVHQVVTWSLLLPPGRSKDWLDHVCLCLYMCALPLATHLSRGLRTSNSACDSKKLSLILKPHPIWYENEALLYNGMCKFPISRQALGKMCIVYVDMVYRMLQLSSCELNDFPDQCCVIYIATGLYRISKLNQGAVPLGSTSLQLAMV